MTQDRETMYQVSTFNALSQGVYDGSETFRALEEHGDTGLGTLAALDGELIGLNGTYYQMKSDGSVVQVKDDSTTPFAIVTFFETDWTIEVTNVTGLASYLAALNGTLENRNVMYVFEAHGHFSHVKARSVPAQQKPYPVLTEAVKNQTVFDFNDIDGTIVGVWFPDYMAGVNVAGFHLHFIADDRRRGGHLLDFSADSLATAIDETENFRMALPHDAAFGRADIGKTNETAVGVIER
ncbi:MAG TPA: acetolactate decarboxylase [Methanocella sp.]